MLPCYAKAMDDINVKSLAEHDLMVLCKAYCDTAAWMILDDSDVEQRFRFCGNYRENRIFRCGL
jgi:hypothetical protein